MSSCFTEAADVDSDAQLRMHLDAVLSAKVSVKCVDVQETLRKKVEDAFQQYFQSRNLDGFVACVLPTQDPSLFRLLTSHANCAALDLAVLYRSEEAFNLILDIFDGASAGGIPWSVDSMPIGFQNDLFTTFLRATTNFFTDAPFFKFTGNLLLTPLDNVWRHPWTSLEDLTRVDNPYFAYVCLTRGANPIARGGPGKGTALHWAVLGGLQDTVRFLVGAPCSRLASGIRDVYPKPEVHAAIFRYLLQSETDADTVLTYHGHEFIVGAVTPFRLVKELKKAKIFSPEMAATMMSILATALQTWVAADADSHSSGGLHHRLQLSEAVVFKALPKPCVDDVYVKLVKLCEATVNVKAADAGNLHDVKTRMFAMQRHFCRLNYRGETAFHVALRQYGAFLPIEWLAEVSKEIPYIQMVLRTRAYDGTSLFFAPVQYAHEHGVDAASATRTGGPFVVKRIARIFQVLADCGLDPRWTRCDSFTVLDACIEFVNKHGHLEGMAGYLHGIQFLVELLNVPVVMSVGPASSLGEYLSQHLAASRRSLIPMIMSHQAPPMKPFVCDASMTTVDGLHPFAYASLLKHIGWMENLMNHFGPAMCLKPVVLFRNRLGKPNVGVYCDSDVSVTTPLLLALAPFDTFFPCCDDKPCLEFDCSRKADRIIVDVLSLIVPGMNAEDLNANVGVSRNSALHWLAMYGSTQGLQHLIQQRGADVDFRVKNSNGHTPFDVACNCAKAAHHKFKTARKQGDRSQYMLELRRYVGFLVAYMSFMQRMAQVAAAHALENIRAWIVDNFPRSASMELKNVPLIADSYVEDLDLTLRFQAGDLPVGEEDIDRYVSSASMIHSRYLQMLNMCDRDLRDARMDAEELEDARITAMVLSRNSGKVQLLAGRVQPVSIMFNAEDVMVEFFETAVKEARTADLFASQRVFDAGVELPLTNSTMEAVHETTMKATARRFVQVLAQRLSSDAMETHPIIVEAKQQAKAFEAVKGRLLETAKELDAVRAEKKTLVADRDRWVQKCRGLEAEVGSLTRNNGDVYALVTKQKQLADSLVELTIKREAAVKELTTLSDEVEHAASVRATVKKQVSELEEELRKTSATLQKTLAKAKKVQEQDATIEDLRRQLKEKDASIQDCRRQLKEKTTSPASAVQTPVPALLGVVGAPVPVSVPVHVPASVSVPVHVPSSPAAAPTSAAASTLTPAAAPTRTPAAAVPESEQHECVVKFPTMKKNHVLGFDSYGAVCDILDRHGVCMVACVDDVRTELTTCVLRGARAFAAYTELYTRAAVHCNGFVNIKPAPEFKPTTETSMSFMDSLLLGMGRRVCTVHMLDSYFRKWCAPRVKRVFGVVNVPTMMQWMANNWVVTACADAAFADDIADKFLHHLRLQYESQIPHEIIVGVDFSALRISQREILLRIIDEFLQRGWSFTLLTWKSGIMDSESGDGIAVRQRFGPALRHRFHAQYMEELVPVINPQGVVGPDFAEVTETVGRALRMARMLYKVDHPTVAQIGEQYLLMTGSFAPLCFPGRVFSSFHDLVIAVSSSS